MKTKQSKNQQYSVNILLLVLLVFLTFGFINNSYAQEVVVNGNVSDNKGVSLPGATVTIKEDEAKGTQTDFDGDYSINVPSTQTVLVYRYLGYVTKEVVVGNQTLINVVLDEDAQSLDEVVLIGYGSARKQDLTGSVVQIDSKEFQKGFVTNAEQLIANKVAGVQIAPISGKPGAGSSFLLRGGASLSASNNPLFVIDGVPIGLSDGPGVLSSLNPNDISSFSILKDASAAAIYGSRGSNGVIIITTKRGSSGKIKISFSSKASVSTNIYKHSVLTGDQYREVAEKASAISGTPISRFNLGTANTDWQDEIFKDALTTDNSIAISGGIDGLPYRLSMGYLDQDGTLKTGNFKRGTITLNINPNLFDNHLKINLNLKGIIQKQRKADEGTIFTATTFDPTQPVRDENSVYGGYWQYEEFASNPAVLHGHNNPVSKLEQIEDLNTSIRSIGNIQLDYKLHFFLI